MSFFKKNQANDCTDVSQVIKDQHDGNRGVELIMNEDGEMVAVPSSQVNQMDGIKALYGQPTLSSSVPNSEVYQRPRTIQARGGL